MLLLVFITRCSLSCSCHGTKAESHSYKEFSMHILSSLVCDHHGQISAVLSESMASETRERLLDLRSYTILATALPSGGPVGRNHLHHLCSESTTTVAAFPLPEVARIPISLHSPVLSGLYFSGQAYRSDWPPFPLPQKPKICQPHQKKMGGGVQITLLQFPTSWALHP